MKNLSQKSIAVLAALVLAAGFAGCNKQEAAKGKDAETEAVYAVNTYKISAGNLDEYLEFGGDVGAVNSVAVMPDMAGKVARFEVTVGQMVKKDQILAYVDASRPGMNYSLSPVKAPISGRVVSLPPSVGSTVSQAVTVASIAQTDDLEIKVSVAERFVSRIAENQKAVVTFDAYPGVEFNARVFEVSPVLDTTSRTMAIKLRIEPADKRIKVGMYARVRLITDSVKNAIVIPNTAIITRDGKPYVFTVATQKTEEEEATVKLIPVTVGISVDNKTEIAEGLAAGDEIVIKGQTLLNDGAKVNIIAVTE
jgi:multidrug efflux pump subunit AcrA (membrane-fusion protein)